MARRKETLRAGLFDRGHDWYVDSVNGDDGNSGKSRGQALKTIGALLSKSILPGQSVGLAAGSHWDEEFVAPVNAIRVEAYGVGDKPVLDCSQAIEAGSWSKTAGRTNVYQASVELETEGVNTWVSVWEANARLARAADLATCDATPGSYYPSSDTSSPITLYVHSVDSSNPGTNGRTYEYSKRKHGFTSRGQSGVTVRGIETRRSLHHDGSLVIGKFGVAVDCVAREGNKHNVYARTGAALHGVVAENGYFGGEANTLFVYNEDTPDGEGVLFVGCTARNTVLVSTCTGFYGHRNVSGGFGAITLRWCEADHCGLGYEFVHADTVHLSGCRSTDCTRALGVNEAGITYLIEDHTHTGGGDSIISITTTDTITIRGGSWNHDTSTSQAIQLLAACTLVMEDAEWTVADEVGWPIFFQCYVDGVTLSISGCTFNGYRGWAYYLDAAVDVESDYNRFVNISNQHKFRLAPTSYATLADWQAAGYDVHSVGS